MSDLTANNLKNALWETLNEIKSGNLDSTSGAAIAAQAREIMRTTNAQLRVSQQSKRDVPASLITFSEG